MKFTKKILTEEFGVLKSNKKTFTKDAKQKIVMTEEQLNRLLNVVTEDSSWEESLHYGKDMGQDDKELYDLKHDDGGHVHIKDLEDDIHYDHDHDDGIEGELNEKAGCCTCPMGHDDFPGCTHDCCGGNWPPSATIGRPEAIDESHLLTEGIKCFDFDTLTGLGDAGCTGGQSCEGNEILDSQGNGTGEWEYCCGGCDDWGPGSVADDRGRDEWLGDGPVRGTATGGKDRDYGTKADTSVTVGESQLRNIIKRTINESQLLLERPCAGHGDCDGMSCCCERNGGGGNFKSPMGCSQGGTCTCGCRYFDGHKIDDRACGDFKIVPNDTKLDAEREVATSKPVGKGNNKAKEGSEINESRILKTTETINESEVNKMRVMFNRMNSTGKNYNPARS